MSGGSGAYSMMFPAEALSLTKGETRTFTVKADSGSDVFREFCPTCGVHLFSHNSGHPQFRSIKIGVFDDPSWFHSQGAIWTAAAQPWHRIDPDLPSWETQPSELPKD